MSASTPSPHISLRRRIGRRIYFMNMAVQRWSLRTASVLKILANVLMVLTCVGAVITLCMIAVNTGYYHTPAEYAQIRMVLRVMQVLFIINVLFNLVLRTQATLRESRVLKWIVDIAILTTLLPLLYPHPENPWLPWLEKILYSQYYLYPILIAYSVVTLSYAIFRLVGRRTNPSLLLSGSFLVFIFVGAFLLQLPKCTYSDISYTDALFVSTSAVSITGLTTVDVAATFTPLGLTVIAVLIQIGALGVLTFTSFFALFFSGGASIYSQLMLKDMVYSKTMNSLVPTLLYIMAFTICVEIVGGVLIFLSIHDTLNMTLGEEIGFSAFHSISAFCNAGFSSIEGGLSNPLLLGRNVSIYWIMSLLIIAGAIGFPILVNVRDAVVGKCRTALRRMRHRVAKISESEARPVHVYDMNTKIVLVTFGLLFVIGAAGFFILEYHNSLEGMPVGDKITQSVFNSATPRSAGFSSVSPAGFMPSTLVMVMALMWVGGASQSTAGGVKVNTLAAIWLNLRAILTGRMEVNAFGRRISVGSIRRANAVVALSIISYALLAFTLLTLEPQLRVRDVLFEALSALFTVGSSLGATPQLCTASKLIVCVAMFVGRVGLISLLTGLVRQNRHYGVSLPSDNIIIN